MAESIQICSLHLGGIVNDSNSSVQFRETNSSGAFGGVFKFQALILGEAAIYTKYSLYFDMEGNVRHVCGMVRNGYDSCTTHNYLLTNSGYIRQPLKRCSEMTTTSSLDGSDSLTQMFSCHG